MAQIWFCDASYTPFVLGWLFSKRSCLGLREDWCFYITWSVGACSKRNMMVLSTLFPLPFLPEFQVFSGAALFNPAEHFLVQLTHVTTLQITRFPVSENLFTSTLLSSVTICLRNVQVWNRSPGFPGLGHLMQWNEILQLAASLLARSHAWDLSSYTPGRLAAGRSVVHSCSWWTNTSFI